MLQTPTDANNVDEVADSLDRLTNDTDILVYTDVIYAACVMQKIASVKGTGGNVSQRRKESTHSSRPKCCL